jgi:hypothetical protein
MKKFLLAACGALLFGVVGSAAPVSFATSGSLLCNGAAGCSGSGTSISFTSGSAVLTIQYNSNSESNLESQLPGATTNFGSLLLSCSGCVGVTESFALAGATLQLSINQTLPAFGTQAVFGTANLLGTLTVTFNSGTGVTSFGGVATVDFPNLTELFGSSPDVLYVLQEPQSGVPGLPNGYALSIGNTTTLQGVVISPANDVPEPGTMALIGLGLASLGLLRRRA